MLSELLCYPTQLLLLNLILILKKYCVLLEDSVFIRLRVNELPLYLVNSCFIIVNFLSGSSLCNPLIQIPIMGYRRAMDLLHNFVKQVLLTHTTIVSLRHQSSL